MEGKRHTHGEKKSLMGVMRRKNRMGRPPKKKTIGREHANGVEGNHIRRQGDPSIGMRDVHMAALRTNGKSQYAGSAHPSGERMGHLMTQHVHFRRTQTEVKKVQNRIAEKTGQKSDCETRLNCETC